MKQYSQFCLDLWDTARQRALNLPDGWVLCNVPRPNIYTPGGSSSALVSWEAAYRACTGNSKTSPGTGRFTSVEGSPLVLVRPGEPNVYFMIPTRRPDIEEGAVFLEAE